MLHLNHERRCNPFSSGKREALTQFSPGHRFLFVNLSTYVSMRIAKHRCIATHALGKGNVCDVGQNWLRSRAGAGATERSRSQSRVNSRVNRQSGYPYRINPTIHNTVQVPLPNWTSNSVHVPNFNHSNFCWKLTEDCSPS